MRQPVACARAFFELLARAMEWGRVWAQRGFEAIHGFHRIAFRKAVPKVQRASASSMPFVRTFPPLST